MPIPGSNTTAYLVSNLDFTGPQAWARLAKNQTVVMIIDATIGENRPFEMHNILPYVPLDARILLLELATATPDDIAEKIACADIIHLCGGNTFYLLDWMQRTNLSALINARANEVPLTLIGESAGALVMGRDLAHIAPLDTPEAAPNLASTAGLGWVDALLVPHYKGEAWGFGEKIDAWLATDPNADTYTLMHDTDGLMITPDGTIFWLSELEGHI